MPQLNKLNIAALLECEMYALIIARESRDRNTEQPIAARSRFGWTVAQPKQQSTPTREVFSCQTC